jgi:L-amino acid N-acyltransferase YncA
MKLILREIPELTTLEYNACYSLNLRDQGMMRSRLIECRQSGEGYAVILQEDDGKILSWALVFPWDLNKDQYGAYFYTRRSARRKGYGKLVAQKVAGEFTNIIVWPSDQPGIDFFNNYNFTQRMTYWSPK